MHAYIKTYMVEYSSLDALIITINQVHVIKYDHLRSVCRGVSVPRRDGEEAVILVRFTVQ